MALTANVSSDSHDAERSGVVRTGLFHRRLDGKQESKAVSTLGRARPVTRRVGGERPQEALVHP